MSRNPSNLPKIIVIGGPTCSGKSDLGIYLAKKYGGEIINADSLQVYKYFDIGTAKPDPALRKTVPHHLVDVVEPDEEFDAKRFVELADSAIEDIKGRGKIPIVVGGTGLYIRALLFGLFEAKKDKDLRRRLSENYLRDPFALYEKLLMIDSEYAKKISPKDRIRIVRALEVYYTTGRKMSEWEKIHGFKELRYDALFLGLHRERKELYFRISERVDRMLANGWIEEVRSILSMDFPEDIKPMRAIGYSDILRYLKGELSYTDMVRIIKKKTRNYAKRQITWFSKEKYLKWFVFPEEIRKIEEEVRLFLGSET
ncbi:MAG: tRNA (adenosine(37)-N6)-dimethylallyltransferase MiaA [Desulfobacterota bacterium]|nr:tRNA (adenosine(37)-N6)-dimethylallyltransferase MiaA [Thermodesulfobacteriota bacterium]MDW8001507.1 tRNA (adenosine(37)-N6)-dimethylallyltransferase MiaA [Deltaproteobacteria bacterium]